ncbi:MAG: Bug family tripartite tricarboxylate transporter substrate binding protein [Janthinobacterium lividum]
MSLYKKLSISRLTLALVAAITTVTCGPTMAESADSYPSHSVRVLVPAPPGGTNDIVARIVSKHLSQVLGQSFFVDNRGGGNGAIAAQDAARAKPDGYTILISYSGVLAVNESLVDHPSYDVEKDFAPISLLAEVPIVLVANSSVPSQDLKQFVAYVKSKPGKINMAIPVIGSMHHLLTEQLKLNEQLNVGLIPYQGSGPAIRDLLGGYTNAHFDNLPAVISNIQAGSLHALAVTSTERQPLLPKVATVAEQGFPYLTSTPWFALVVPKDTPQAIQQKLHDTVVAILKTPEVKEEMNRLGAAPRWSTQAETLTFINGERVKWRAVIKAAHVETH